MAMPQSRAIAESPVREASATPKSPTCSNRSTSTTMRMSGGMAYNCLPTEIFSLQRLPPFDMVAKCVSTFFECTGTLFFVLKELEAMEMLRTVYSRSKHGATAGTLSQLMLIAAVGSQYLDAVPDSFRAAMFNTGRLVLDRGCFNQKGQELLKARAAALVGVFLVFEKTMLAREYLTQAILIAQSQKLDSNERSPELGERDWLCWKRLWRTCIFFERWLASLVGYMPVKINEEDPVFSLASDAIPYCDMETRLQGELVKLGVLSADVVEDMYSSTSTGHVDYDAITKHSQMLKTWYDNLPSFMTLEGIENSKDRALKSAVRFTHCVYLSANLLLTRNAFAARIAGIEPYCEDLEKLPVLRETANRCADTCVLAAQQLADLLVQLITESMVSRKCYLIIHSSFNACLILMLNAVASAELHSIPPRDATSISKCLYVLEFCAKADIVAFRDLETLRHFNRELQSDFTNRHPQEPKPGDTTRQFSDSSLQSADSSESSTSTNTTATSTTTSSRHSRDSAAVSSLLTTVKTPFGGEDSLLPPTPIPSTSTTTTGPTIPTLPTSNPDKGFNWRFVTPDIPTTSSNSHSRPTNTTNILISNSSSPSQQRIQHLEASPTRKRGLDAIDFPGGSTGRDCGGRGDDWRAPMRLKSLNEYREFFKRV